ncbi:HipA domain-containing protein [Cellulomonas cellasea]|uniref:HipA domain-containing protein n=1 Tax=Cellulomonas cellasea TaxID=43670 RepID=UPI0025A417CE|nr:HipA domain-containing protein [Cellulomonas cellasea]MDM8085251.1 HipA domain-containing protein [Cellulomonas cellasea]
MSSLDVWLNEVHVARLDDTAGFGMASLQYTDEALDRFGLGTLALSVRLPVRKEAYNAFEARNWMDGLLPEGELRAVLADRFRLATDNTVGLLAMIGRECAGAVAVTEAGEGPPASAGVRWLDDQALEQAVDDLATAPFGVSPESHVRVSLGGIQDKLVLVERDDGALGLPLEATPSTHILKPSPLRANGRERWPGIVHAELFAMRALDHAGLDVAQASYRPIDGRPAILVRRYDRETVEGRLRRLHQEDMCQALGLAPTSKYQQAADPLAPSLKRIAQVLSNHAAIPLRELERLLEMVLASLVLGNCDQHAKNISMLIDPATGVRLAPSYDVVSTASLGVETVLSLIVGGETLLEGLTATVIDDEVTQWGLGRRAASRLRGEVLDRLEPALATAYEEVSTEAGENPVAERAYASAQARASSLR